MAARETAGTLTTLWESRVNGAPLEAVIERLNGLRTVNSQGSRDTVALLLDILESDDAGTKGEAAVWAVLIGGWTFGFPPVPEMARLAHMYPLTTTPTWFCEHCGTSGLAPGDGRTECGFCR